MTTLFISDLHLHKQQPKNIEQFIYFLKNIAPDSKALYILGDLFEAWIGDDFILPEYNEVLQEIKSLSQSGVPVYVMHGNRDFLLHNTFEELTDTTIIPDPSLIDLDGQSVLLMHGDLLCTDDQQYQNIRKMVRDPKWQKELLSKTPEERITLAKQYREQSKAETANKPDDIMDVNQNEVKNVMREYKVTLLIHGHTHRPMFHDMDLDGTAAKRIVLSDWREQGSYLRCAGNECEMVYFG